MTLSELRNLVGGELEAKLTALALPDLGLYYDVIPDAHEQLVVRFWFPVYGGAGRAYGAGSVKRPLLQVDVKHYPPAGSSATPAPAQAEAVWEAVLFDTLPGIGCSLEPSGRPPAKDPADNCLWGWHRYRLTV